MPTTTKPCSDTAAGSGTSAARGRMTPSQPVAAPAAPCCTGLECIEKPRFFCGQLLTDLDLEAAMDYISAKNRLHNRYLFGAGVVCGLGVRCDPCDSASVIIDPGYALDCLGNDIIVCAAKPFNVAEYLDCRKKTEMDCGGSKPRLPKDCETPEKEYCLVLSYDEKPAKPVSALIRDNGCRVSRCEPSRTLEVFKVDLIDQETAKKLNVVPNVWSTIISCILSEGEKVLAFLNELAAAEQKTGQDQLDAQQAIVSRLKEAILNFSKKVNPVHCNLIEQLCALDAAFRTASAGPSSPSHGNVSGTVSRSRALIDYFLLYVQLLIDCVCNAFLVPCNDCCEPEYVLLACLTIRDGKVIDICNTVRTQVISGPSIRYWLQPVFDMIGRLMEFVCCTLDLSKYVGDQTTFSGLHMKYMQGLNLSKVARAYSSTLMEELKAKLSSIPNPKEQQDQTSSLNFYHQPIGDVQEQLAKAGVNVTVKRAATMEEAYALGNLPRQGLTLKRGANVEILVGPDNRVTSIRNLQG